MIEALQDIPALTEAWLAALLSADRELHFVLAASLIIEPAGTPIETDLPAGLSEALSQVDLRGKEIGAFRFAPSAGQTAPEQIARYDALIRQDYDVEGEIVFVGEYGSGNVFVSPQGVGLLDPVAQPPRIRALAANFSAFLIVQANAYDAYKRFLVKGSDTDAYRASAEQCARSPAMNDAEVQTIFDAQRTA